jgi:hypothetical protein
VQYLRMPPEVTEARLPKLSPARKESDGFETDGGALLASEYVCSRGEGKTPRRPPAAATPPSARKGEENRYSQKSSSHRAVLRYAGPGYHMGLPPEAHSRSQRAFLPSPSGLFGCLHRNFPVSAFIPVRYEVKQSLGLFMHYISRLGYQQSFIMQFRFTDWLITICAILADEGRINCLVMC